MRTPCAHHVPPMRSACAEFNVRQAGATFLASDVHPTVDRIVTFRQEGVLEVSSVSKKSGAVTLSKRVAQWPGGALPANLEPHVMYKVVGVSTGINRPVVLKKGPYAEDGSLAATDCPASSTVRVANPPRRDAVCTEPALHSRVLVLTTGGEARVSPTCDLWLNTAMLANGHTQEDVDATLRVKIAPARTCPKTGKHIPEKVHRFRKASGAHNAHADQDNGVDVSDTYEHKVLLPGSFDLLEAGCTRLRCNRLLAKPGDPLDEACMAVLVLQDAIRGADRWTDASRPDFRGLWSWSDRTACVKMPRPPASLARGYCARGGASTKAAQPAPSNVVTGEFWGVTEVTSTGSGSDLDSDETRWKADGAAGVFATAEAAADAYDRAHCGAIPAAPLNFPKLHRPHSECTCNGAAADADRREETDALRQQVRRQLAMADDPMCGRPDVVWACGQFSRSWLGGTASCAPCTLVWLVGVHAQAWSPTRRLFWQTQLLQIGTPAVWADMEFGEAKARLLGVIDALEDAERHGQSKDMAGAQNLGSAKNGISPRALRNMLDAKGQHLKKFCAYVSLAVLTGRVGHGNVRRVVMRLGCRLSQRGTYLTAHALGSLCMACGVTPGGDKHQHMGAGWTKQMVEELENVTGKGIGALARLCQMKGLTWRSVAYFYCVVLKDPAGRADFLSKLGRLK